QGGSSWRENPFRPQETMPGAGSSPTCPREAPTRRGSWWPLEGLKLLLLLAASLLVAAAVAQAGIIGFVGLITPHLLRRLLGEDYRLLLPASALGGAVLLTLADLLARTLTRPAELPVGVVTTLLGGPFFLYLMWRRRGRA
ncbi:FecCD family ABC transporter permease, partial [Thermus scotoductus]|uniref:FecCD family ABC transporter permease n=1 Tax=Thermus scotoductus TaxID=37636 RepID=UPI001FD10D85